MSRSLFLGLLIYGLLLAGMATVHGEMFALMLPLVAYLLAGFLFIPDEIKLEATRHLSAERVSPNSEVHVTVTVTNLGMHLEEMLIEDDLPEDLSLRSGHHRHLIRLPKGGSYTFTYSVSGPRGGYGFEKVKAKATDHLAVAGREVQLEAKGQLFIFPPVTRLHHVAIHPRRTRVFAGLIPARAGGSGTDFFGVREYQPGDPTRTINWRASARSMEALYSNEFQQERVADVGIVLDGRMRANEFAGGHSLFEHSVQAAAALADALLTQGNRVGLLVYAMFLRWTIPGYGKVQRERILYSLAHARPGGSEVFNDFAHLPTRLFPPESQIILVSPLLEDDLMPLVQLRAQGYQVLVVSPDPVQFELSYLKMNRNVELASRVILLERRLLLQKVRRAGIQVLSWDVNEPFDQVVKRKLGRPPAWLRELEDDEDDPMVEQTGARNSMTLVALVLSIVTGILSLAYGYSQEGLARPALWIVLLGIAWVLAHWRRLYWFSSIAFLLMIFAAGFGVWQEFPLVWMFLGALGGLLGWDLSDFARRLRYAAPTDNVEDMEKRHLARVGIIAALGIGLAYLSTVIQVRRLAFEVAVGLILLAALGLTRLVLRLRKY